MAKKLTMPKAGTAPASSPLHNMIHNSDSAPKAEAKKVEEEENKRTTFLINPTTYRRFKAYAAETGQFSSQLFTQEGYCLRQVSAKDSRFSSASSSVTAV